MKDERKVIIEKYKNWDYINNHGFYVWTNKYGDVIRVEDNNGIIKEFFNINVEAIQDMQAYHGINAEAELTALLTEHLALEIDREIIQELLRQNANP